MGLIKRIKRQKKEKVQRKIILNSFILLGFNVALSLGLFFTLTVLSLGSLFIDPNGVLQPFMPLVAIFLFASISAVIWFRFGQIVAPQFKKKNIFYTAVSVLISVILMMLIMLFLALIFSAFYALPSSLILMFLGTLFITLLAIIFELPVVTVGALTAK